MSNFFKLYGYKLLPAIGTHLYYVIISVAIGFIVALLGGILLSRIPRFARVILPILSIFQTIPGIVFIGILFLYLGMKPITVILALSIYALFPMLKNTYVGIVGVAPEYKEAAKGCGMSAMQTLLQVELPLASPSIFAGLRMATVYTVSWAVLATMIGLGGLGEFIYIGVSSNNNSLIIAGAIPAAILAVCLSRLIEFLKQRIVPKALRREIR